jgi:hypothetical protein
MTAYSTYLQLTSTSGGKILTGVPTGKRLYKGLEIDGRTILKWILNK